MAYNQATAGEELVPVIKAILRAADEINYAAELRLGRSCGDGEIDESRINTNEIVELGDEEKTDVLRGSWRLLLDQNNKARWSPCTSFAYKGHLHMEKIAW